MHRYGHKLALFSFPALVCLSLGGAAQTPSGSSVPPATAQYIPSAGRMASAGHGTASGKTGAARPAAISGVPTVTVRAASAVVGRTFTLGEIADIKGGDAGLRLRLAGVEIGASPIPGFSRQILPGDVIIHLRAAHCGDLLDAMRIHLVVPPGIQIRRAGQDVGMDRITQAAVDAAQPAIKDLMGAILEPEMPPGKITIPTGKLSVQAGASQGQPEQGSLRVPVSLMIDGKVIQTVEVMLRVRRKLNALVARNTLDPRAILTADDVVLSLVDLPAGFTKPVLDVKAALGKWTTRRVLAGMPIPADALETPPDIAADVHVIVSYVIGAVAVSLPGRTRQAGRIGDTIRIYMPDTRKELEAVVVDSHTVRIIESNDTGN
jgi:flagella basal body P-ring formation protein FlgA